MIAVIALVLVLLPVTWFLAKYVNCILQLSSYPPGPFPLPIIGNLHIMMVEKPEEALRDLAKVYGEVFSLSFGMKRVVIVNSIQPAREALITKSTQFAGRPTDQLAIVSRGNQDIVMGDYGPYWKLMRKLCHSALRMYGDGLGNLESKIKKESEELHLRIKEGIGKPIDINNELALTVLNVICSLVFGHRYQIDDPEFGEIFEMNRSIIEGLLPGNPVFFFPWLRFFPNKRYESLKKGVEMRDAIIGRNVAKHKETFDPNVIRDLTDSLIKSSKDTELLEGAEVKEISNDQLEMVIFDIFFAGAETTYTTLRWSILYLLHYPKIQDILYKEILDVVGCERYPELKDRASLHFVQATMQETLRMSSIVRLNLSHKAIQDGTIGGKNIPKGTEIHFNLWNMHNDDGEWEKPEEFNPYRWLNEEKKYVPGKHKSFLPFSAGKRSCLGESLAKTELFLVFSRLVRDFKFEPNLEEAFPSREGRWGVVYTPLPFTVLVSPRST